MIEGEESGAELNAVEDQPLEMKAGDNAYNLELGQEETRRPIIARRPVAPTEEMVEEHNRTHAEYRDWCKHRRKGKSTGLHHRQGVPSEDNIGVTISVAFAFRLREEQEDDLIPILVAHDNYKKSVWALEVEKRGISNTAVAVE